MPRQPITADIPRRTLQEAYAAVDRGASARSVWQRLLEAHGVSLRAWQQPVQRRRQQAAELLRDILSLCQALAPRLTRTLERAGCLETWSILRQQSQYRDLPDSTIDKLAAEKIKRLWPGIRVCPSGIRHWRSRALAMGAFNDLARGVLELWGVKLRSEKGAA